MARQTLTEWINNGNVINFPTISNLTESQNAELAEATRENIMDWFGLRQIVPHFDIFMSRVINRSYPYYVQLLRIDPTKSNFDWLVDNYLERQTTGTENGKTTGTSNASETGTPTVSETITGTISNTGTDTNVRTGSQNVNSDRTTTTEHTGTDTNVKSGSEINNTDKGVTVDHTGTDTTEETGTDKLTRSGSINRTKTGSETTTQTGSESTATESAGTSQDGTRTMAFGRNNPMSAEYTTLGSVGSGTFSATAGDNSISSSFDNSNFVAPGIVNPTTSSDSLNNSAGATQGRENSTTTFDGRAATTTFDGRSDVESYDGYTETHTPNKTTTINHNTKEQTSESGGNTITYQNVTDARTLGTKDTTTETGGDTTTYNSVADTRTLNTGTTNNETRTTTNTLDKKTFSTEEGTNDITRDNKEIATGRNQNIPDLLTLARNYIIKSPAWDYLKSQIEPCFYQLYNIDDLIYSEDI